jgi:ADP-ribosyl-[dinitrogen reductase] hydrolase
MISAARGCLFGGIVGDAFGSPYQFRTRGSFAVTPDMEPCENFRTPAGAFTDDSSMMLCLARSLTVAGFDVADQMHRYGRWLCHGYMSSMTHAFDIGVATRTSIMAYAQDETGSAAERAALCGYGLVGERYRGNGGIMRLAPSVVFAVTETEAIDMARRQCAVTHADPVCTDCAGLMARVLWRLLHGAPKDAAVDLTSEADLVHPAARELCLGELPGGLPGGLLGGPPRGWKAKCVNDISTSGYVVDTLEAALWALWTTDNYEEGVMLLASLGDDADTTCCVFGQLAGALYGHEGVPKRWESLLQCPEMVDTVVEDFLAAAETRDGRQAE